MSDTDTPSREDHRYPQVVRFVRDTPWAILETKLHEITELIAFRASGGHLTDEEIQARIGAGPARKPGFVAAGGVAVIPIYGVITPKADLFTEMSGGTSIDRVQSMIAQALGDESISAILLDVNSPGGSAAMLAEAAASIRNARKQKPVFAVANHMAASAAYYLASQASEFAMTPSGSVGSVGVIAGHEDISGMEEQMGVKTTLVTAGKYKGELSPFKPLSEDAKAQIQKTVDTHYAMFVADVAKGRGVSVETVRSDFGQGRMLMAKDALAVGMVDRIASFDQVLAEMTRPTRQRGGPSAETDTPDLQAAASGLSFADEAEALRDNAEALVERTTSLAEVERGHLTVSKRERLTACTEALRETVTALEGVLADTAPDKQRQEAIAAFAAFEFSAPTQGARA